MPWRHVSPTFPVLQGDRRAFRSQLGSNIMPQDGFARVAVTELTKYIVSKYHGPRKQLYATAVRAVLEHTHIGNQCEVRFRDGVALLARLKWLCSLCLAGETIEPWISVHMPVSRILVMAVVGQVVTQEVAGHVLNSQEPKSRVQGGPFVRAQRQALAGSGSKSFPFSVPCLGIPKEELAIGVLFPRLVPSQGSEWLTRNELVQAASKLLEHV